MRAKKKRAIRSGKSEKESGETDMLFFPSVASVASLKRRLPSRLAVVAGATELSFSNGFHGNFIGARLHLEEGRMTGVALVSNSVNPVGKNRCRSPTPPPLSFEDDVAFNGERCGREETREQ
jgi:hypothetical protein